MYIFCKQYFVPKKKKKNRFGGIIKARTIQIRTLAETSCISLDILGFKFFYSNIKQNPKYVNM